MYKQEIKDNTHQNECLDGITVKSSDSYFKKMLRQARMNGDMKEIMRIKKIIELNKPDYKAEDDTETRSIPQIITAEQEIIKAKKHKLFIKSRTYIGNRIKQSSQFESKKMLNNRVDRSIWSSLY